MNENNTVHYMVDIETLGTEPGAAIVSIGVRHFSPKTKLLGHSLYLRVKPEGEMDAGTLAFWLKQEEDARKEVVAAIEEGYSLKRALHTLSEFMLKNSWLDSPVDRKQIRLWGNGATFDNVLLDAAYRQVGQTPPWRYSGHRCFRTLVSLCGEKLAVERQGVHHNALDDADYQVNVLFAAMDKLGLTDLQ